MKKRNTPVQQLSLFDDQPSQDRKAESSTVAAPPALPAPQPGQRHPMETLCTNWSRLRLAEMIELRTWLLQWGKEHSYPAFSFPIGSGTMGDHRAGVMLASETHWSKVLRCEDMEFVAKAVMHILKGEVNQDEKARVSSTALTV